MLFNCIFAYKHLLFETFEMVLDQINDLLDFANPKALTYEYDVGPAGLAPANSKPARDALLDFANPKAPLSRITDIFLYLGHARAHDKHNSVNKQVIKFRFFNQYPHIRS